MHHHILPLASAHDATLYTSAPSPAWQQGDMSALPPAPPLSLGSFGQHLPQHQVLTLVLLGHI